VDSLGKSILRRGSAMLLRRCCVNSALHNPCAPTGGGGSDRPRVCITFSGARLRTRNIGTCRFFFFRPSQPPLSPEGPVHKGTSPRLTGPPCSSAPTIVGKRGVSSGNKVRIVAAIYELRRIRSHVVFGHSLARTLRLQRRPEHPPQPTAAPRLVLGRFSPLPLRQRVDAPASPAIPIQYTSVSGYNR